jgi:hypothetical protein
MKFLKIIVLIFTAILYGCAGPQTRMMIEPNLKFVEASIVMETKIIKIPTRNLFLFNMENFKKGVHLVKGEAIGQSCDPSIDKSVKEDKLALTKIEEDLKVCEVDMENIKKASKAYESTYNSIDFNAIDKDSSLKKGEMSTKKILSNLHLSQQQTKLASDKTSLEKQKGILEEFIKKMDHVSKSSTIFSPCDCVVYDVDFVEHYIIIKLIPRDSKPVIIANIPASYVQVFQKDKTFTVEDATSNRKYTGKFVDYIEKVDNLLGFPKTADRDNRYFAKIEVSDLPMQSIGIPIILQTSLYDIMDNKFNTPDTIEFIVKGAFSSAFGIGIALLLL